MRKDISVLISKTQKKLDEALLALEGLHQEIHANANLEEHVAKAPSNKEAPKTYITIADLQSHLSLYPILIWRRFANQNKELVEQNVFLEDLSSGNFYYSDYDYLFSVKDGINFGDALDQFITILDEVDFPWGKYREAI